MTPTKTEESATAPKSICINKSNLVLKELWWQKAGMSYTATGYGKRIPTRYMMRFNGRMYRVYVCVFSNSGTTYITTRSGDIVLDVNNDM